MSHERLTGRHITALYAVFVLGNSVLIGTTGEVGQDGWMSILLALVCALPLTLLYGRLVRLHPNRGLFELMTLSFGRVAGGILMALMTLYAVHVAAMTTHSLTAFLTITSLPETPAIAMALFMFVVVFYLARKGVSLLGRWSGIVLAVSAVLIVLIVLFALKSMDVTQIAPVGEHDASAVGLGALTTLTFPFGEIVLLLALAGGLSGVQRPGARMAGGVLIGGGFLLLLFFLNLFVLGDHTMGSVYFPTYNAARIISAGHFLERIETLIAVSFLLTGLTKITVCLVAATRGLSRLFLVADDKALLLPVALAIVALSAILYPNVVEMFAFFEVYRLYALLFQAVLPVLLWIVCEVRAKKRGTPKLPG